MPFSCPGYWMSSRRLSCTEIERDGRRQWETRHSWDDLKARHTPVGTRYDEEQEDGEAGVGNDDGRDYYAPRSEKEVKFKRMPFLVARRVSSILGERSATKTSQMSSWRRDTSWGSYGDSWWLWVIPSNGAPGFGLVIIMESAILMQRCRANVDRYSQRKHMIYDE